MFHYCLLRRYFDDLCFVRFAFWASHSLYVAAVCQVYAGDHGLCLVPDCQAGPAGFGGKTARQLAIYKDDVTVPLAQRDVGNPHGGAQLRCVL